MSTKEAWFVVSSAGGILAVTAWLILFSGVILSTHEQNSINRRALLKMRDAIPIGARADVAWRAFRDFRTPALTLIEDSGNRLRVEMPLEAMEEGWKLLIEVESNVVKAVRIRTGDGVLPRDTPSDKLENVITNRMADAG